MKNHYCVGDFCTHEPKSNCLVLHPPGETCDYYLPKEKEECEHKVKFKEKDWEKELDKIMLEYGYEEAVEPVKEFISNLLDQKVAKCDHDWETRHWKNEDGLVSHCRCKKCNEIHGLEDFRVKPVKPSVPEELVFPETSNNVARIVGKINAIINYLKAKEKEDE